MVGTAAGRVVEAAEDVHRVPVVGDAAADLVDVALDAAVGRGQALLPDHRDPHRAAADGCSPSRAGAGPWSRASSGSPSRSPSRPQAKSATSAGRGRPRAAQPVGRARSKSANPPGPATVTPGANRP